MYTTSPLPRGQQQQGISRPSKQASSKASRARKSLCSVSGSRTSRRTNPETSFKKDDRIYYAEVNTQQSKSIYPGTILDIHNDGRYYQVQYRCGKGVNVKVAKNAKKWVTEVGIDSINLHARPPDDAADVQLHFSIHHSRYARSNLSWYARHVMEVERKQKEEDVRNAQRETEDLNRKEQERKELLITKLSKIATLLKEAKELADLVVPLGKLPNSVLVCRDVWEKGQTRSHLQRHDSDDWKKPTVFVKTALKLYERVARRAGRLLQDIHGQQQRAHVRVLQRCINSVDDVFSAQGNAQTELVNCYPPQKWVEMESEVPACNITAALITELTAPSKYKSATKANQIKLFVTMNQLRRMSSEAAKIPLAWHVTLKCIYGGMERSYITEFNQSLLLGTHPKVMDIKNDSEEVATRRYKLASQMIISGKERPNDSLLIAKLQHDNYGKASGDGNRLDGTTFLATSVHESDLKPWFRAYIKELPDEEIPAALTGIETVNDLGSTPDVDALLLMYQAHFIASCAKVKNVVDLPEFNTERKDIRGYLEDRTKNHTLNQQCRKSRHDTVELIEDQLVGGFHSNPSPFWDKAAVEQAGVENVLEFEKTWWDQMIYPVEWGLELYGNKTMQNLLDKFVHAKYAESGKHVFHDSPDPRQKKVNCGDGAPTKRFNRVARGHRMVLEKGGETIEWGAPQSLPTLRKSGPDVIEWQYQGGDGDDDDRTAKAKPGDRLLRVGFPDDSVILISACENGNLCVKLNGVECTQTAASFKEWSPALGDVHDFKHRFYQEILPYEGHFHTQAAALYRCIQQNEAAWDILVPNWRNGDGRVAYLIGCGDHSRSLGEFNGANVGIVLFITDVFLKTVPEDASPAGQLAWMNEMRRKSQCWNQILDMCKGLTDVHMFRNACRTANVEGVTACYGAFTELFAYAGAHDYFQIATHHLLRTSSCSDYETALASHIMFNNHSGKYMPNDLTVENLHYLMARGTGKSHGLLSMVHNTKRVAAELPQRFPDWSSARSTSDTPSGTLGGLHFDPRIASKVRQALHESGMGNLSADAVLKHTGKPIMNDPGSTVVYDFAGNRLLYEVRDQDDVGRVIANDIWNNRDIFTDKCNSVVKSSPPKFDRFESRQTDSHRESLISLVSMPQYNVLHPKPKKELFALHAEVLRAAAANQEQNPSQLIIDIGKLRTSGAGSKQDKKKLRRYVLSEKGNSLPLILAALFRFKRLNAAWAKRVLTAWYETSGSDMVGKVKLMADSSHGAANRRSAALSAIAPKIASLQYANPMLANKVKETADELMTFLSDNAAVQQPATSARTITDLAISDLTLRAKLGRRGIHKALDASLVEASNKVAVSHIRMERNQRDIYSRKTEMMQRRENIPKERKAFVEQRRDKIERRDATKSWWNEEDEDGKKPTLPLGFGRQSFKQAEQEYVRVTEAAQRKAQEEASAVVEKEQQKQELIQLKRQQKKEKKEKQEAKKREQEKKRKGRAAEQEAKKKKQAAKAAAKAAAKTAAKKAKKAKKAEKAEKAEKAAKKQKQKKVPKKKAAKKKTVAKIQVPIIRVSKKEKRKRDDEYERRQEMANAIAKKQKREHDRKARRERGRH